MTAPQAHRDLHVLARLHGVQSAYIDCDGRRKVASPEVLRAALDQLGAPLPDGADVRRAAEERLEEIWRQVLPPVVVNWQETPVDLRLRVPVAWEDATLELQIACENGDTFSESISLSRADVLREVRLRNHSYRLIRIVPEVLLPLGYHRLTVAMRGDIFEAMLICAPRRAYAFPEEGERKAWGTFLPLYALHSDRSLGVGDFTDMQRLAEWTKAHGGRAVGTLPLLASFLDHPLEFSPYSPASRLYWNELYVDPTNSREFERCSEARARLESPEFQRALAALRKSNLVQYAEAMRLKRSLLEPMARQFFNDPEDGHTSYAPFLEQKPDASDYASFRALMEVHGPGWREWPDRLQHGRLISEYVPHDRRNYHLYVQLLAHNQIGGLARKVGNGALYLDLPLGVNNESYDMWRYSDAFASGASVGAPPDPFFTGGQDWGFAPMHPQRIRKSGYEYFIRSLRHHMSVAGILRIDHAMCFHRLFWIPQGMPASDGLYVRYEPEEFYAILALESVRNRTVVVGEDLGTVPGEVRRKMDLHDIRRTFVAEIEMSENPARALNPVPSGALAGINTHDFPPFASWWTEKDLREQVELGYLKPEHLNDALAGRERVKRNVVRYLRERGRIDSDQPAIVEVLEALLLEMTDGAAGFVLLNVEDLWAETERQNAPGTTNEVPNWRRKARWSLEDIVGSADLTALLDRLDAHCRKHPRPTRSGENSAAPVD